MRQFELNIQKISFRKSIQLSNFNPILSLILLNIFLVLIQSQAIYINPISKTINANTTYQVSIIDSTIQSVQNTTAFIEISLPTSYFSFTVGSSFTCFSTDVPSTTYTCKSSATNVIKINNPLISGGSVFKISIGVIKNPSSAQSIKFSYVFKYANNTLISQSTKDGQYVGYIPSTLQSCSATFLPNIVHSTSQLTVTIILGNQIPKNGSIIVTFPSSWTDSSSSTINPIISSGSLSCTKKSTNSFLISSLSCSVLGQQILMSNVLNITAPSGSSLSFAIGNILSPPTVFNGNSITVTTSSQTAAQIDKTACLIDIVNSQAITGIVPETGTSLMVGVKSFFSFSFNAPVPMIAKDRITMSALAPNDAYFSLSVGSSGYAMYNGNAPILTSFFTNSSLIACQFPSSAPAIPQSTLIKILQQFYIKPSVASGTRSLSISLKRNGNEYALQTFAVTVAPNNLQSVSISADTLQVSTLAAYTFVFTLTNQLMAKSRVSITLPNQLSMITGSCVSVISALINPSNINSSSTCNVASNRVITLGSINTNTLVAGQKLTIKINSILNSQTTQTTGTFNILTLYGLTQTSSTDISTDKTIKMSPATIGVGSVLSGTLKVGQQSIYTVSYTVKTKFLSNSKIRVSLPSDISIGSSLSSTFSITYVNSTVTIDQSCLITSFVSNSIQYLQISGISSVQLPALTVINLKISKLVNPLSLKPSNSFGIFQVDSKGFDIQKLQTGLIITMTQVNTFSNIYSSQSTIRMNGETATYTINFKSSVDLNVNDYFFVELETTANKDSQISFINPMASCDITYTQNGATLSVTNTLERISSTVIKASITQAISSSITYQMSINSIQRSRTAETPSKITLRTFKFISSSISFGISSGTISPEKNNKQNTIQSVALNIVTNPSQLFSFQSFSITIIPKNSLFAGDYLIVDVPSLYMFFGNVVTTTATSDLNAMASQSLCIESQYFCSHQSSDPYRIKVQQFSTQFSNSNNVTVTIKTSNYRSPSTFSFTGYYFKAKTYSSSNLLIDSTITTGTIQTNLINAEFSLSCKTNLNDYHCRACNSNGTCISCYQNVNVNSIDYDFGGFKYLTSDLKCIQNCGNGYFINTVNNICTKCDSPCLTCATSSASCLSCIQTLVTNKYFAGNKSCIATCPDTYFSDSGNICQSCSISCSTCQTDANTCLTCPGGTFLNSNTKTCVSSTSCPFGTFADTTLNKCQACDTSCNGCTNSAKNCVNCNTGYIVDFSDSTLKNCTNRCPAGKVNDTINNLGCRCQTQCKTCQNKTSTCTTCDSTSSSSKYFYSNTCVGTCPSGTYVGQSGTIDSCISCSDLNCKTCDATGCLQCSGEYLVFQGACVVSCQTGSVLTIQLGIKTCKKCSVGCSNCDKSVSQCTTCQSGYLKQGSSTGTYCTTACSSDKVSFNNSICQSSCPDGYQNVSNVCKQNQNNNSNSNTGSISTQLSTTRTVPFPFTIALVICIATILLSKLVLSFLLVSALLTAIVGLLQPLSWLVVVIVCSFETSQGSHWGNCSKGVILLIVALIINLGLNIVGIVFFKKYISIDSKFSQMLTYNQKRVIFGKCPTYSVLILSLIFSHKVIQFLFSNFLKSKHFSYKLSTIINMNPLNYLIFASLLPSVLAIVGGSVISYQLQSFTTSSASFIASIDMIIITLIGIIVGIWNTNRKKQDYEVDIQEGGEPAKHYETEQIFVEGNGNQDISEQINQVFLQQSGIRSKHDNKGKGYYYKTSRAAQIPENHDNDPLSKRTQINKPITQSNSKKIKGSFVYQDHSSQALVINEKKKRKSLQDEFSQQCESNQDKKGNQQDDLQVIDFKRKRNSIGDNDINQDIPLISKIIYPSKKKQKPQQLLTMSNEEKQSLKEKIETQIDEKQKQKLDILTKERQLRIKKKKQQIEQILKIAQKQLQQLRKQDQLKIAKIREAVDVLKRKQIKVQEYLLYTEIIREQEGQYNDSQQQDQEISEINEKTQTIIKGHQDEDNQLEQVINLSPKKVNTLFNKNLSQRKRASSQQIQESQLRHSGSNLKKSGSKDKKSESKQKTIKNKKHQKTNKKHKLNDLQVNYQLDQNGIQSNLNQNEHDKSFDSQDEPQLPKTRSNILGKGAKSRNLSQHQLNMKKGINRNQDIVMVDVRSNRYNRTQNQFNQSNGGQLQQGKVDDLPPRYLHSTEKVDVKNKNKAAQRNILDSDYDRQTLKSFENPDLDFYNQISPSQFHVQNHRFDVDQTSDIPVKPKILAQSISQNDTTLDKKNKRKSPIKNDGFDIYEDNQINEEDGSRKIHSRINSQFNRYQVSQNNDEMKSIMIKDMQNKKLKQLQQIYLPRLQSKMNKKNKAKRDLSTSKISRRSKQKV